MADSFRLVYGDLKLVLPLPFDDAVEEQLLSRLQLETATDSLQSELARRVVMAIAGMIDGVTVPPTERQLKYAQAISDELSVALPANCLTHQEAARSFITRHAPEYRRRRGHRAGGRGDG